MKAIKVIGPFRGGSGYDHHTRAFVREFVRQGVDVQLEELQLWSPTQAPHARDPFFESLRAPVAAEVELHFAMPHQVWPTPGRRIVNYTMFEATRVPGEWAARAAHVDLTVLPTHSSLDAWVASGVPPEHLRISPLGVRLDFPDGAALPLQDPQGRPLSSYQHRFLNIAELSPRKNLLGLIRAWVHATSRHDDAVLIAKTNVFRPQLQALFLEDLAEALRAAGKQLADCAPVVWCNTYLTDEHMPGLYRSATHYISLSFGEGWDMPMIEAASAGLALVAPRHSAYLEYLDDECAYLIPARESAVAFDTRLSHADASLFHGLRWWAPDGEAAAARIRAIIDGRAGPRTSPRARIQARYGWDNAARQLLEVISQRTDRRPARPAQRTGPHAPAGRTRD